MSRKTTIKCERCGTEKWYENWRDGMKDETPCGFQTTVRGSGYRLNDICIPCQKELHGKIEAVIYEHEDTTNEQ